MQNMQRTKEIIVKYYEAFNNQNMIDFFALLHDEVVHDINEGKREKGKEAFKKFMERMNECYREEVKNLEIFINEKGYRAAAEFEIDGTYLRRDDGLPEAKGQTYYLQCGAFFEIEDNKIIRVTNYYNISDWLKQVSTK